MTLGALIVLLYNDLKSYLLLRPKFELKRNPCVNLINFLTNQNNNTHPLLNIPQ